MEDGTDFKVTRHPALSGTILVYACYSDII